MIAEGQRYKIFGKVFQVKKIHANGAVDCIGVKNSRDHLRFPISKMKGFKRA